MSAEQVTQCTECLDVWPPDDDERSQACFDTDDNLVFYCPDCAGREFDN